jgi:hypothetical protein
MGGFNLFSGSPKTEIKRMVNINNNYFEAKFYATFFKIDSWDNENAIFSIGPLSSNLKFYTTDDLFTGNICGNPTYAWNEAIRFVELKATTNLKSLPISITSDLSTNALDESWGIRDIQLLVNLCHISCSTCFGQNSNNCNSCVSGFLNDNSCVSSCPSGKYPYLKVCEVCHSACKECNGPLTDDCLKCKAGTYLLQGKCLTTCPDGYYQDLTLL